RDAGEVLAVDAHVARARRQQSQQRLHQGGLAAAVWAEQAPHFAGAAVDGDAPADGPAGIAETQLLGAEAHCQPRRAVANSHRKNGAPMNAVKMPIGTSITATVRANVSTAKR